MLIFLNEWQLNIGIGICGVWAICYAIQVMAKIGIAFFQYKIWKMNRNDKI